MEEKCNLWKDCNAPICPLFQDNSNYSWFPDEEICRSSKLGKGRLWIKNQRKIAKVISNFEDGYFSLEMLNRNPIIKKGIKGLNPDSELNEEVQLKSWLRKHPEKRKISEEERKKRGERMKFFRKKKKGLRYENLASQV